MKSTNYCNTFIEVAEDCPVDEAEAPPERSRKTNVRMQYEMVVDHPYEYTSDDVIFNVFAEKNNIADKDKTEEWNKYFSKGRACLRSSSLGKRYGWGTHHNSDGKIAIYAVESDKYSKLVNDESLEHLKAMRSSKG